VAEPHLTGPAGVSAPGILVAEDDPALLNVLELVFRRRGFGVWPARDGRAAVELFRRHRERIAVVLLDVLMPGLDGPQALGELRRLEPGVACCLMSGHTGSYDRTALEDLGAARLYEKPFCIYDVADELWEMARQRPCRSA
jgi:two-component system, cell cycle sensor histidine kinase and response regulator CckA